MPAKNPYDAYSQAPSGKLGGSPGMSQSAMNKGYGGVQQQGGMNAYSGMPSGGRVDRGPRISGYQSRQPTSGLDQMKDYNATANAARQYTRNQAGAAGAQNVVGPGFDKPATGLPEGEPSQNAPPASGASSDGRLRMGRYGSSLGSSGPSGGFGFGAGPQFGPGMAGNFRGTVEEGASKIREFYGQQRGKQNIPSAPQGPPAGLAGDELKRDDRSPAQMKKDNAIAKEENKPDRGKLIHSTGGGDFGDVPLERGVEESLGMENRFERAFGTAGTKPPTTPEDRAKATIANEEARARARGMPTVEERYKANREAEIAKQIEEQQQGRGAGPQYKPGDEKHFPDLQLPGDPRANQPKQPPTEPPAGGAAGGRPVSVGGTPPPALSPEEKANLDAILKEAEGKPGTLPGGALTQPKGKHMGGGYDSMPGGTPGFSAGTPQGGAGTASTGGGEPPAQPGNIKANPDGTFTVEQDPEHPGVPTIQTRENLEKKHPGIVLPGVQGSAQPPAGGAANEPAGGKRPPVAVTNQGREIAAPPDSPPGGQGQAGGRPINVLEGGSRPPQQPAATPPMSSEPTEGLLKGGQGTNVPGDQTSDSDFPQEFPPEAASNGETGGQAVSRPEEEIDVVPGRIDTTQWGKEATGVPTGLVGTQTRDEGEFISGGGGDFGAEEPKPAAPPPGAPTAKPPTREDLARQKNEEAERQAILAGQGHPMFDTPAVPKGPSLNPDSYAPYANRPPYQSSSPSAPADPSKSSPATIAAMNEMEAGQAKQPSAVGGWREDQGQPVGGAPAWSSGFGQTGSGQIVGVMPKDFPEDTLPTTPNEAESTTRTGGRFGPLTGTWDKEKFQRAIEIGQTALPKAVGKWNEKLWGIFGQGERGRRYGEFLGGAAWTPGSVVLGAAGAGIAPQGENVGTSGVDRAKSGFASLAEVPGDITGGIAGGIGGIIGGGEEGEKIGESVGRWWNKTVMETLGIKTNPDYAADTERIKAAANLGLIAAGEAAGIARGGSRAVSEAKAGTRAAEGAVKAKLGEEFASIGEPGRYEPFKGKTAAEQAQAGSKPLDATSGGKTASELKPPAEPVRPPVPPEAEGMPKGTTPPRMGEALNEAIYGGPKPDLPKATSPAHARLLADEFEAAAKAAQSEIAMKGLATKVGNGWKMAEGLTPEQITEFNNLRRDSAQGFNARQSYSDWADVKEGKTPPPIPKYDLNFGERPNPETGKWEPIQGQQGQRPATQIPEPGGIYPETYGERPPRGGVGPTERAPPEIGEPPPKPTLQGRTHGPGETYSGDDPYGWKLRNERRISGGDYGHETPRERLSDQDIRYIQEQGGLTVDRGKAVVPAVPPIEGFTPEQAAKIRQDFANTAQFMPREAAGVKAIKPLDEASARSQTGHNIGGQAVGAYNAKEGIVKLGKYTDETIGHELQHAGQAQRGQIMSGSPDVRPTEPIKPTDYAKLPWEREAISRGDEVAGYIERGQAGEPPAGYRARRSPGGGGVGGEPPTGGVGGIAPTGGRGGRRGGGTSTGGGVAPTGGEPPRDAGSLEQTMKDARTAAEKADLAWRASKGWSQRPTWFTRATDRIWNPTTMTLTNLGQVLQSGASAINNAPSILGTIGQAFGVNAALGLPEGFKRMVGRGNLGNSYADFMYNPSKTFREAMLKNTIGAANVGYSISGLYRAYQNFLGGQTGQDELAQENRESAIGNQDFRNIVRGLVGARKYGKPNYPIATPEQKAAEQKRIDEINAYNAARGLPPISTSRPSSAERLRQLSNDPAERKRIIDEYKKTGSAPPNPNPAPRPPAAGGASGAPATRGGDESIDWSRLPGAMWDFATLNQFSNATPVGSVKDADTFYMTRKNVLDRLRPSRDYEVRLRDIDAPETRPTVQPGGQEATQFAQRYTGEKLVYGKETGAYGRLTSNLARPWYSSSPDVQRELVSQGHAWNYPAYSQDQELQRLQEEARKQRRGLWAKPNPTPPWEFRQQSKK